MLELTAVSQNAVKLPGFDTYSISENQSDNNPGWRHFFFSSVKDGKQGQILLVN